MIKRNDQFLTIALVMKAIRRRIVAVVLITGLMSAAGLGILLTLKDIYASEGEFYLNAGRGTVTIDPSATTSQVNNLLDTRQSEIQSIKDMLGGRVMMERTARRVGLDRLLDQKSWYTIQKENIMSWVEEKLGVVDTLEDGMTAEQTADLRRVQASVEYIADRITINGDKEGNTVQIRAKAHTSLLAHDIVDALMAEFSDHYVNVHRTVGSQNFFETEYLQAEDRVRKAEADLADYKNEMRTTSIESKANLIQRESEGLQSELLTSKADLVAITATIEQLNSMIAVEPEMKKMSQTARSSVASDAMREELYRLEIAETQLASIYADDHPLLSRAREALEKSRSAFDKQDAEFGETSESANPLRETLLGDRMKANAQRDGLIAKIASLQKSVSANEDKMEQLNNDEIEISDLMRSVELTRGELREYSQKREEVRRQANMDIDLISALAVSQEATHVIEKVGPRRLLALAIILVGSFFVACAVAVYQGSTHREEEDFGVVNGYGGRLDEYSGEAVGLHQRLNHIERDNYTILSGRANPSTQNSRTNHDVLTKQTSVHVTDNLRG